MEVNGGDFVKIVLVYVTTVKEAFFENLLSRVPTFSMLSHTPTF